MQESGCNEVIPLICTLAIGYQDVNTPWVSSGFTMGVAAVWWLLESRCPFLLEFPRGSPSVAASGAGDCDVLCLLRWQERFHFSTAQNPLESVLPPHFPFLTLRHSSLPEKIIIHYSWYLFRPSFKKHGKIHVTWASRVTRWQRTHLPMQEALVWLLGWQDPLEEETATHSSILAWEIP